MKIDLEKEDYIRAFTVQPMLHETAMINFQRLFGRVRPTEQVLKELADHA